MTNVKLSCFALLWVKVSNCSIFVHQMATKPKKLKALLEGSSNCHYLLHYLFKCLQTLVYLQTASKSTGLMSGKSLDQKVSCLKNFHKTCCIQLHLTQSKFQLLGPTIIKTSAMLDFLISCDLQISTAFMFCFVNVTFANCSNQALGYYVISSGERDLCWQSVYLPGVSIISIL